MSRVGRKTIDLPNGVEFSVQGGTYKISGPEGKLTGGVADCIRVEVSGGKISVAPADGSCPSSLHGLYRSLINNAVIGVSKGWERKLELVGVGFQASIAKDGLSLNVGFSHPVVVKIPEGVRCQLVDPTHVTVRGVDRQAVGQFCANVRSVRPPEPYKGKGIKYSDEVIKRKAGKAFGS